MDSKLIDIQGHRGCRGLLPENTLPAMIKALEIGVNTLEMDVVITKDKQVLLSHEPFMNEEICLDSTNLEIGFDKGKEFNIYQLTYSEILKFDCGSKGNARFPDQQKMKVSKPLLKDVIKSVKEYTVKNHRKLPYFNIEIKSTPKYDNTYHPGIAEYCELVMELIIKEELNDLVIIQSFDPRVLVYMHKMYPKISLAYLLEDVSNWKADVDSLGFQPDIISPYFPLLSQNIITEIQETEMKVIPWTINDKKDIENFIKMGIDGIISDYPNLVVEVVNSVEQADVKSKF